jgi:hypothetical protein
MREIFHLRERERERVIQRDIPIERERELLGETERVIERDRDIY